MISDRWESVDACRHAPPPSTAAAPPPAPHLRVASIHRPPRRARLPGGGAIKEVGWALREERRLEAKTEAHVARMHLSRRVGTHTLLLTVPSYRICQECPSQAPRTCFPKHNAAHVTCADTHGSAAVPRLYLRQPFGDGVAAYQTRIAARHEDSPSRSTRNSLKRPSPTRSV